MNQLKELFIPNDTSDEFDFSKFPNVELIYGEMPIKYKGIEALGKLKRLNLRKYRESDFSSLSHLLSLEELKVYGLHCETFAGLESLKNLRILSIEKAPRLIKTKGIGHKNISLDYLRLYNCKNLADANSIGELPNLRHFMLSRVNCLDSIAFLNKLNKLDFLYFHPDVTSVANDDYYPIVKKLMEMGKIEQLKGWKNLEAHLNNSYKPSDNTEGHKSELQKILDKLPIRGWTSKLEDGLLQYTKFNCQRAIAIIESLVRVLESNINNPKEEKIEYIKNAVIQFNHLNNELNGVFIETGEREELCDIFDNLADAVGIDTLFYEDGISYEWREW